MVRLTDPLDMTMAVDWDKFWIILHVFFLVTFSQKSFRISIKLPNSFRSRLGLTFCQASSGSKLFAKVHTICTPSGEKGLMISSPPFHMVLMIPIVGM